MHEYLLKIQIDLKLFMVAIRKIKYPICEGSAGVINSQKIKAKRLFWNEGIE